jgi:glyoxylase-like metal-dependent hydrolase (beta-lactamase superfamily II)
VQPVMDAGLATPVSSSHVVLDERLEAVVRLWPTPGHTPGHLSVVLESAGRSAVVTGDCVHHPL